MDARWGKVKKPTVKRVRRSTLASKTAARQDSEGSASSKQPGAVGSKRKSDGQDGTPAKRAPASPATSRQRGQDAEVGLRLCYVQAWCWTTLVLRR
jgi:hypothetical protein